jgi:hypothetical protein
MDVFRHILDTRQTLTPEDQRRASEAWQLNGQTPEARLLAFDRWLRQQLDQRLEWAWAGAAKEKRIEQCRIRLEQLVLDLWRRGWMLDGRRLARHLETVLDRVGTYQRAGKVQEFWAYFSATVDRYVGANAEEIQAEALRAGAHVGAVMSAILNNSAAPAAVPLPELLAQRSAEVAQSKAETLREKQARERARQAACKAAAAQPTLF